MELQIAFDLITSHKALEIAKNCAEYADVFEMGTPFAYRNPIEVISEFRKVAPKVRILADYKILDGGYEIAEVAFRGGADIVTVSARTWNDTIRLAIQAAKDYGKEILVDLMGVPDEELEERTVQVDALNPDYICVHRAVSVSGSTRPDEILRKAKRVIKNAKIAVAGGISLDTLPGVVKYHPELVIVGGAICNAEDPAETAKKMKQIMMEA